MNRALLVGVIPFLLARAAPSQSSNVQALYGWHFQQPGIAEDVPKNVFTFTHSAAGTWWSNYLFVDVSRSWSEADANAKEVYGEWYPSLSLWRRSTGFVRNVSLTMGLNTGVRSTGTSPFVVLPGLTFGLDVPGFTFLSLGAFAYVDRGRFEGQPSDCQATAFQLTPSWSLPFRLGDTKLKLDGFLDYVGKHANCESQVLSQPQLLVDISGFWHKPGRLYLGVEYDYWHNKYGISGLEDKVLLPMLIWVL